MLCVPTQGKDTEASSSDRRRDQGFHCHGCPTSRAQRAKSNPKAQASLDVEWDKFKKAWDMGSVREWEDVSKEAKRKGKKVHVGKVFRHIC